MLSSLNAFISCGDLEVSVHPNVLLPSIVQLRRHLIEQPLQNLNVSPRSPKWVTEPGVLLRQLETEQPVFVPSPGSLWLRLLSVLIALLGVAFFWSLLNDPFLSSLEFGLMKSSCFLLRCARVSERCSSGLAPKVVPVYCVTTCHPVTGGRSLPPGGFVGVRWGDLPKTAGTY